MQRLVEQPSDNGEVFEESVRLGAVHYHLSVYQHFSDVENEPVPEHIEVEGRIVPRGDVDLADLHHRDAELTLRLADGRTLDFSMVDAEGRIRSTRRGLYR
jgi:hypothetical protein